MVYQPSTEFQAWELGNQIEPIKVLYLNQMLQVLPLRASRHADTLSLLLRNHLTWLNLLAKAF